jgi:hypothetical protein
MNIAVYEIDNTTRGKAFADYLSGLLNIKIPHLTKIPIIDEYDWIFCHGSDLGNITLSGEMVRYGSSGLSANPENPALVYPLTEDTLSMVVNIDNLNELYNWMMKGTGPLPYLLSDLDFSNLAALIIIAKHNLQTNPPNWIGWDSLFSEDSVDKFKLNAKREAQFFFKNEEINEQLERFFDLWITKDLGSEDLRDFDCLLTESIIQRPTQDQ